MKNIRNWILLLSVVLVSACSNNSNKGPEVVAKKFIEAIYTADFDKAKNLCTEDSKEVVNLLATLVSEKISVMKGSKVSYEITELNIAEDGLSATVKGNVLGSFDFNKDEIVESKEEKIKLVKVDEKWLVDYKLK